MATYTDNLHLEKPAQSDLYNISVFNGNADIIDSAMAARALAQNQATIEASSTASRNYAKGEFLVYNGLLYKVTSAIASGGTITPGTNCVATNTGAELKALNDSLSRDNIQDLSYLRTGTTADANLAPNGVTYVGSGALNVPRIYCILVTWSVGSYKAQLLFTVTTPFSVYSRFYSSNAWKDWVALN